MPDPDDLTLLCDAARAAGTIARSFFDQSPQVWDKGGGAGPVTEADLAVDVMLRETLTAARPDYGWLSEETEDTPARLDHDSVFVIDPIDGTRAFIAGETSWSHSLAVVRGGAVVAAAVYVPMLDKLYAATVTGPATLNGQPIATSGQARLDGATLLAAKSNLSPEHWAGPPPPVTRKFRPSLAYRLCLVAEGRYDAMLTLRDCWEWDIAAGALIVERAGGRATDRAACTLTFNSTAAKTPGCLAGGAAVHGALHARLAAA